MYPCRTGSSVCAAAALIPPAPSPASFENTPRKFHTARPAAVGNSRAHRSSRYRLERKRVPYYRKQYRGSLRRADHDYHSCPAQIKECHSGTSTSAAFCNGTQSALSPRAEEESASTNALFLPRQTYPASPAQSSLPASYCPFRDTSTVLPAKHSQHLRQLLPGNALVSVTIGPPQYVPSFFASGTAPRENSQKIFKASPTNRRQHHPSQCSLVLQAPLRRQ